MTRRCINDKKNGKESRKTIDEFNMKAYYTYFKIKLGAKIRHGRLTLSASHAKKTYDSGRQATEQHLNLQFL